MDVILQQLGGLLLKAIPTFVLVVLLSIYLKAVLFGPMGKVLKERYDATGGARKLAEETLARASAKTAEYEGSLRAAKSEVYQSEEKLHKELQEKQAAEMAAARQRAQAAVKQAREEIAAEMEQAKAGLASQSDALANQIAETILGRSAA